MVKRPVPFLVATMLSSLCSSQTVIFSDNFNRPDGNVGTPYGTWHASDSPADGEIFISNGTLRTAGAHHQEGGVFIDGIELPPAFRASFLFKTDSPADGGFHIRFGANPIQFPGGLNPQALFEATLQIYVFAGTREANRVTTYTDGSNHLDTLSAVPGQKSFSSWTSVEISQFEDKSTKVRIDYLDGSSPINFLFPAISQGLYHGNRLIIGNSNASVGPHYFDDVRIQAIPEPTTMAFFGIAALVSIRNRSKASKHGRSC